MPKYSDIEGVTALAIRNNRPGFIAAMNASGYPVAQNITENELYESAMQVFYAKGISGIRAVLDRVRVNKSTVDNAVKNMVAAKFAPPNQRFGDWFNNTINWFGDLLGGSSSTVTTPVTQSTTTSSALSPGLMALIVVAGVILIALFRKFTAVVVAIVVIVLSVILYGIFAKITSTTTSGGGSQTQTHAGLGSIILGWIGL